MILIATLVNEEDGITVTVTRDDTKFHVRMRDDDSGNLLPHWSIYSNEAQAMRYAHRISGVEVA